MKQESSDDKIYTVREITKKFKIRRTQTVRDWIHVGLLNKDNNTKREYLKARGWKGGLLAIFESDFIDFMKKTGRVEN